MADTQKKKYFMSVICSRKKRLIELCILKRFTSRSLLGSLVSTSLYWKPMP